MKITTVLSVSSLLALFSVVACSSPTTTASTDGASTDGDSKDDGDATPAKKATTPSTTTGGTSSATNTSTDKTASDAACNSCVMAKGGKAAAERTCEATCKNDDDACFEKCWTDNCGTAETNECTAALDSCSTPCAPPAPTADERKACDTCVAGNATAKKVPACADAAKSEDESNTCFEACNADQTCSKLLDTCADTCGF